MRNEEKVYESLVNDVIGVIEKIFFLNKFTNV